MNSCTFIFDVIVTSIQSANVDIDDPKNLKVELQFNGSSVPITPSRINVSEFKDNAGIRVTVNPMDLRKSLEKCGIPITVTYSGFVFGVGQVFFPDDVIEAISDTMPPVERVDTCVLSRDATTVGSIEILSRLSVTCVERPIGACRLEVDTSINKEDILFILGESQRACTASCDPCVSAWEKLEDDDALKFGTYTFGNANIDVNKPKPTFLHTPTANAACCDIKGMADECERIINMISMQTGIPKPLKPPCRRAPEPDPCSGRCEYKENDRAIGPYPPCYTQLKNLDSKSEAPRGGPISETRKKQLEAQRFCPICLTSLAWIPKFAACPTCCLKPMPNGEDHHERKRTAEEMLFDFMDASPATIKNYLGKPCENTPKEKHVKKESGCRCTCKYGKLCAFCRVRQMCVDITGMDKKPVTETEEEEEEEEHKDYCDLNQRPAESRPFLSRVFSELRDLNNVKDAIVQSELQKQCESKGAPKSRLKGGACLKPERKSFIKERSEQTRQKIKAAKQTHRPAGPSHVECMTRKGLVSRRHGWNWSSSDEALKYGWQPGLIRRPIARLMKFFLTSTEDSKSSRKKKAAAKEESCQGPTLNVCKKNGEIFVTLRALDDPNVKMHPIVFKLVKSDLAKALSEIKRKFKAKGFRKCICHNSVMMCECRQFLEKKCLEYALEKECKRRGMESCVDHLVLTDTSESELEFNFDVAAPAHMVKAKGLDTPRTTNMQTQTVVADKTAPHKYPIKYGPYWRAVDCATDGRFMGTAFGAPCENVFEDGVFGYRGGGPHGNIRDPHDRSRGGPMRVGGRGSPGGPPGGVSFPYGEKKKVPGSGDPIPVRMTQRYYKGLADAAKARKQAKADAAEKKRRGPDMIKYLINTGTIPKPWNPNDFA